MKNTISILMIANKSFFFSFLLILCLSHPSLCRASTYELYKAFAFGADNATYRVYNATSVYYTKIIQDGDNFNYTAAQGYGYTDYADMDSSANTAHVFNGDDQIYDQHIGADFDGTLIFRVDVPDGMFRFVAALSNPAYTDNHITTLTIKNGSTGSEIAIVEDVMPAGNEVASVGFQGKIPPPYDGYGAAPYFVSMATSPAVEINNGYLELHQKSTIRADIPAEMGADGKELGGKGAGDICLLEVWVVGDGTFVTLIANDPVASESGNNTGEFTLTRSTTVGNLTLNYAVSGSAQAGIDYQTLPGSIVIPDGQSSVTVSVVPVDNPKIETADTTVILTLSFSDEYINLSPFTAAVTIQDDDLDKVLSLNDVKIIGGEKGYVRPALGEKALICVNTGEPEDVIARIFTMNGVLVWEKTSFAGTNVKHIIEWPGKNENGNTVSSGVYLVYIESNSIKIKKKVIIVR